VLSALAGAAQAVRRFRGNRRASAAVEFALCVPLLLTTWAGLSEMSNAVDNWRKATQLARTVADLTAQGDTANPLSTTLMSDILASAEKVMQPFDTAGVKIVVSAMGVDLINQGLFPRVCSSVANSAGTARTVGTATGLTVPVGYQTTGMRYVFAEVSVTYTPMIGSALVKLVKGVGNQITFTASFPWPARGGKTYGLNTYAEVVLPATNAKACDGSTP
jgi:Flp pilus assembly protein TadG